MKTKLSWGEAINKILPGDFIHDEAPSTKQRNTPQSVLLTQAAQQKRLKKLEKKRKVA